MNAVSPQQYRDSAAEVDLQDTVVKMARYLGYLVFHPYDMTRNAAGWPDLAICGHGLFLLVELKTAKGTLRAEQENWWVELMLAGVRTLIVRPADVDRLQRLLERQREMHAR